MVYSPHTLYKKCVDVIRVDELGKPLPPVIEWVRLGRCRCDDDNTQELVSDNGHAYRSHYHVVYDRSNAIVEGDEVRCMNDDGSIRGQGVARNVKSTNYLSYSELWM